MTIDDVEKRAFRLFPDEAKCSHQVERDAFILGFEVGYNIGHNEGVEEFKRNKTIYYK